MRTELSGIEKGLNNARQFAFANGSIIQGLCWNLPFAWVISGIGRENAESAISEIAVNFSAEMILVLGFAGSLTSGMRIGDLVICESMRCLDPAASTYSPNPWLVGKALSLEISLTTHLWHKECLTVDRILSTPEEKTQLSNETNSGIVDMENYWIAKQANQLGIDCFSVRAISDGVQDRLPNFDRFLEKAGNLNLKRSLQYFSENPEELKILPRLYQNAGLARKSLLKFFWAFYPFIIDQKGILENAH